MAEVIVCREHWQRLHWLVCERGLGHLIHQPHDEFEAFAAELCGRHAVPLTFDPMALARQVAEGYALEYGGSYLNQPSAGVSDRCPICELVRCEAGQAWQDEPDDYWPRVIVDDVTDRARAVGLTPRAA